jgi:hypothetical protein
MFEKQNKNARISEKIRFIINLHSAAIAAAQIVMKNGVRLPPYGYYLTEEKTNYKAR